MSSVKGLARSMYVRKDAKGNFDPKSGLGGNTGIFISGNESKGTKSANITNIQAQGDKVFGDDGLQDMSRSISFPSVALDHNAMGIEDENALLGLTSDGKGGYAQPLDSPNVAVLLKMTASKSNTAVYLGFQNGQVIQQAINAQTNTEKETDDQAPLTFNSMAPFDADGWNNQGMKRYVASDPDFDEIAMYKDVFGMTTEQATALKETQNPNPSTGQTK